MQADIRYKNYIQKSCIWRPLRHIYVFSCTFLSYFSSGIMIGVRQFENLIDFDFQVSLKVASILLHFISVRAWVGNPHIKSYWKSYVFNAKLFLPTWEIHKLRLLLKYVKCDGNNKYLKLKNYKARFSLTEK